MFAVLNRFFGEGFRVFFLAAGLYAVFTMIVWEGWLGIHAAGGMVTKMPFAAAPHLWHAHEMIFGYATAALGGFFLTAVPNWTGARAARHLFIIGVVALWLAGRVAVWASASLPAGWVALAELAFLPVLAAKIALQLIKRPKPQNMMFLLVLSLIWVADLLVQADWIGWSWGDSWAGLRAGLLGVVAMIAVLGGRITPAFTRNAMLRMGFEDRLPITRQPLEIAAISSAIALPAAYLLGLPEKLTAVLAIVAGVAALARLAGWRGLWARSFPILWSMHLAFAMLGLGYLALGLAAFDIGSEVAALHLLGIGAAGGMTIAVMSRASLGHTGRPLIAPGLMVPAYLLVALAAALRWAGSVWPELYYPMVLGAGAAWIIAFTLYLAALGPVLLGPRLPRTPPGI